MPYIIVCKSDNKYFLLMNNSSKSDEPCTIRAYETKEDVMEDFKPYTKGWTSSYERSMSCTFGMMNMQPVALKAPEVVGELKKYIIEEKVYHITGGAMNGGYHGIPVLEEILNLKEFNIWDESLKIAGIIK